MLLEIGSLYQLPLWYQAYLDCTSSSLPPSVASSLHPSLPVSLLCAIGMTGSLVIGGLTYGVHFPECFAPGKFDVWVSPSLLPSRPSSLPPSLPRLMIGRLIHAVHYLECFAPGRVNVWVRRRGGKEGGGEGKTIYLFIYLFVFV